MNICYDILEKFEYKNGKLYTINSPYYVFIKECECCGNEFLATQKYYRFCENIFCRYPEERRQKQKERMKGENHPLYGIGHSEESRQKISKSRTGLKLSEEVKKKLKENTPKGENSHRWKSGGAYALYDEYAYKLEGIEELRRDPNNYNAIQVKCALCNKWFTPTSVAIRNRILYIYKHSGKSAGGESRLYCCVECKKSCPLYAAKKYQRGQVPKIFGESTPQLRKIVLDRDNNECQICGNKEKLNCHHINPVSISPIEAADIDNCITVCEGCHLKIHQQNGCKYSDLRNFKKECKDY